MGDSNNINDNEEIKNEYEAFEEPSKKNYSPDDMRNIWYFRFNESLKAINESLQTIAIELKPNRTE